MDNVVDHISSRSLRCLENEQVTFSLQTIPHAGKMPASVLGQHFPSLWYFIIARVQG